MRQNDRKNYGVPKMFYWPIHALVWKCLTNDFELLLSENFDHTHARARLARSSVFSQAKTKISKFLPRVRVRQNDMEKLWRTKRFLLAHWFGNVPQIILSYF